MTDTSLRTTKRADELEPGDLLLGLGSPRSTAAHEVLAAYPYSDGDDLVLVVYRDSNGRPATIHHYAAIKLPLATDAELAEMKAKAKRTQFIAGLREFADWAEANPWAPLVDPSGYIHPARLQIDLPGPNGDADAAAVATVREYADRFGVKVDEHLDDRTDASTTIGSVEYSVIAWHRGGRPAEPKSQADDDPIGLSYSRADDADDDPTPISPARVPLHFGAMTAGGLIDETAGCE